MGTSSEMCGHLRLPVDKEATWGGVITVPDDGTTLHRVDWTRTTSKNTMYITHVSGDDLGASGGIAQFYFSIYAGPGTAVTAVF
jgi:hypothetical protein